MSHTDKQIIRDLVRAWTRAEIEFEEVLDAIASYFREGVMPTTPPDGGT